MEEEKGSTWWEAGLESECKRLRVARRRGSWEAPVAAAAPPPPPGALTEALLALVSAGDLGKKLYSVLCRDIAKAGEAQPLCRTERLETRNKPRGDCWREIWGEVRCAEGTLAPAANRQAPGRARAASRAVRARPRPLGVPGNVRRGGGARPRGALAPGGRSGGEWAWRARSVALIRAGQS